MGKLRIIPENLTQQVMEWTAEGKSGSVIVSLLKEKHNIKCSLPALYRLVRKERQQRQEIAKAKYAEEMEKTAASDIRIMSDVIETYYKKWKETTDVKQSIHLAAELRMWVRDKMALSGLELDSNQADDDVKDELLDELEDLKSNKIDPNAN